MDSSVLDASSEPFNTAVKGFEDASHYTSFLGSSSAPTALCNPPHILPQEQTVGITIDWSSIFVPGSGGPQYGFRRTELIAPSSFNPAMEIGTTRFHFSIKADEEHPLDYTHEYQVVFIEPATDLMCSPFTIPTAELLPAVNATSFKILDHNLNVLYATPFSLGAWHNFAVDVDWDALTLQVSYSTDGDKLKSVTGVVPNLSAGNGVQGDFHFGILKLPLANPDDTPEQQADVVHYGIQMGNLEGLL
ncbi:hypothetical protein BDZ89DRAFT_1060196, partial [Hymenopellis radicata]